MMTFEETVAEHAKVQVGDTIYRDAVGRDIPRGELVTGHVIARIEDEKVGVILVVRSWIKRKREWTADAVTAFEFIHPWRRTKERR